MFKVVSTRMQSGRPLVRLEGISAREEVKDYIGQAIWARRVAFEVESDEHGMMLSTRRLSMSR